MLPVFETCVVDLDRIMLGARDIALVIADPCACTVQVQPGDILRVMDGLGDLKGEGALADAGLSVFLVQLG